MAARELLRREKCKDCKYFSWRDHVPENEMKRYAPPDGYCGKIFPRGYAGAGKPGGTVFHGKPACFQYEPREELAHRGEKTPPG